MHICSWPGTREKPIRKPPIGPSGYTRQDRRTSTATNDKLNFAISGIIIEFSHLSPNDVSVVFAVLFLEVVQSAQCCRQSLFHKVALEMSLKTKRHQLQQPFRNRFFDYLGVIQTCPPLLTIDHISLEGVTFDVSRSGFPINNECCSLTFCVFSLNAKVR